MHPAVPRVSPRVPLLLSILLSSTLVGFGPCVFQRLDPAPSIRVGSPLFASPQVDPLAVSADGTLLYVANTTSGSVSLVDVTNPSAPVEIGQVMVGMDPVGVAVRPKVNPSDPNEDELVFVTNHISDSISVVSRARRAVVQTLQGLEHADGSSGPDDLVTTTDEPVGVAFDGPCRAFVTLDQANQILRIDADDENANGLCDEASPRWTLAAVRIPITAQAPRALAVAHGRLFVAAFESGNQTELPTCGEEDPRFGPLGSPPSFDPTDPYDMGCQFKNNVIDGFGLDGNGRPTFQLGTIFDFAARNPNIGGRVIIDRDVPDRDLFVFDLSAPNLDSDAGLPGVQPMQVISHLGTLLYGVTGGSAGRVYVTNTDARNQQNGLRLLGNRMFDDRVSVLDCSTATCSPPTTADLDAGAASLGNTFPTPYGVAASRDGGTLVVTAAGADGTAAFHGVYVLDANGQVLGGAPVGAIPQGVALRSDASGAADRAFVLNTVDSTLSVVDVRNAASPLVEATISVGADPTPLAVKRGRIHFSSARASTSGTFSCESCHPNGNIDQLLWTINAFESPDDTPGLDAPEPRTTQPIRGLRDTLPLHWEGRLADPFPELPGNDPMRPNLVPGDTAPDCDIAADGEVACIRHLVNASLSGVMCAQPNCAVGPSGLKGALTDTERNELAEFLQSVSFPPAPKRRPSDRLSATANLGVQDFFTDEDGLGITRGGVGNAVGFGVVTCADNAIGCHSLPLTAGTNSKVVGFFDAPSARGMWDRWILFSDGIFSSEEFMRVAQDCAQGIRPGPKFLGLVSGDPCDLRSLLPISLAQLPFPSGEHVFDPAEGFTERGAFMATFEGIFALAYGVRGNRIWEYQLEIGTGLAGLTGRQVEINASNALAQSTIDQMTQLERAVADGKIEAVARTADLHELRFVAATGKWTNSPGLLRLSSAALRNLALGTGAVFTITAAPPAGITGGGPDRQPLLDIDPDVLAAEMAAGTGQAPGIPKPAPLVPTTFRVGAKYLQPGSSLLLDGAVCAGCSWVAATAASGAPAADVTIPGLPAGMHVLQAQSPGGWISNELPVLAK